MEGRHAFEVTFVFTLRCCVNVDFKGCVAAVRKWFSTALTAVKSGITILFTRLFLALRLRWIAGKLKPVVIAAVVVLVSHKLITAIDSYCGLGWSSETRQSLADILTIYVLQIAGFLK